MWQRAVNTFLLPGLALACVAAILFIALGGADAGLLFIAGTALAAYGRLWADAQVARVEPVADMEEPYWLRMAA